MERRAAREKEDDFRFDWAAYEASIINARERAPYIAAESVKRYGGLIKIDKIEHVQFISGGSLRGQQSARQTHSKRFSCRYCEIIDNEDLVIVPDCGHVFHKTCMSDCLSKNDEISELFKSCPTCKEPFTKCYPFLS